MSPRRPHLLAAATLAALLFTAAVPAYAQSLTVGSFEKVSETRITRTVSEFTYRASLTNAGPAIPGAVAAATSLSPATTVVDGTLTFGTAGANATVPSLDTFTFRHDRTVSFEWSALQFTVTPGSANQPPVADAGLDRTAPVGTPVQLDGSGSSDADGDPLTFAWSFTSRPPGSGAALVDPTGVAPSFVVDLPGTYVVSLIVNDGTADSVPDEVVVSTSNSPPVADAGPDQTVPLSGTAILDGSRSTDVDGDVLAFSWSFLSRPAGSTAALSSTTAVQPTFVADLPGSYVLQLVVHDGTTASDPDTVTVSTGNAAPTANAGPDAGASVGEVVTLDGSGSSDPDGDAITFAWSFTSRPGGSAASLSNASSVAPSFVPDLPGAYVVQLIVSDGQADSAPDTVTVTTGNARPTASAGPDQTVPVGTEVQLDGSASSDPEGMSLQFSWSLTSVPLGSLAALSNAAIAEPTFIADVAGTYVAQLIVSDGIEASDPDTVTITADTPEVTLDATDAEAAEAGRDPGTFTVTRTGPTTNPLTVHYTLDGSAANGVDYDLLPASVTIPAGSASADVTVVPIDDAVFELPESVHLTLAADAAYTIGTVTAAVVGIEDNDARVTLTATDSSGSEQGVDPAEFTITREGPTTSPLTVFYSASGEATEGADYQTLAGSVTIPAGASGAAVTIVPIDDALFEGPERVTLNITPNPAYAVGLGQASVTIVDDELPAVSLVATDDTAAEAGPDPATFTVTRTGPTTAPLNVSYSVIGSATNGTDYQTLSGSVTIPAGSTTAAITVAPIDDSEFEGTESVILSVLASPDYVVATGLDLAIIVDNDGATVTITATDPFASEPDLDPGEFTITRAGGDLTQQLLVQVSRVGGTADNGQDYASLGGANFFVIIPANQTSATVTVTPLADAVAEGDETVILTISPRAEYVIGTPGSATVTIAGP